MTDPRDERIARLTEALHEIAYVDKYAVHMRSLARAALTPKPDAALPARVPMEFVNVPEEWLKRPTLIEEGEKALRGEDHPTC